MISEVDVVVQNLASRACLRFGLDPAQLRRENQQLITVDISDHDRIESYQHIKGYDLFVQCELGLASITGTPKEPVRVGASVCDIACGMYAHTEVLRALIERESSGEGRAIQVSLFDAIADWMTVPLLQYEHHQRAPERVGLRHPFITPYGMYRARLCCPCKTRANGSRFVTMFWNAPT